MNHKDMVIVIPVLNEKEGIKKVLEEVIKIGIPKNRIIVIDGHSTDGTPQIAMDMGVKVVYQDGFGKANAIKKGIEVLTRFYQGIEYVIFLDGDCTYSPSNILDLAKKISDGHDLVIGWRRYREKGSMNILYRFGNWILTKVFNTLFGSNLHDVLSGMYIAKLSILREISFEFKGFSVESEIVAHTIAGGYNVTEIPIVYRRRCGEKKLRLIHGLKILVDIVRLTWRYNPAFLMFFIGSLVLLPGLVLGIYVGYQYMFIGIKHYIKGIIALILSLTGLQSLLLAILTIYIKRLEIRIHKKLREIVGRVYG